MHGKVIFANLLQFLKFKTTLIKESFEKIPLFKYYQSLFLIKTKTLKLKPKFKSKLLNKITKSLTKDLNLYFSIIIISSCIITAVISFIEQNYLFQYQLNERAEATYQHIENELQNYKKSLNLIKTIMLEDSQYLDASKVSILLKYTYITDEYLSLLPLSWHPSDKPNRYFNIFGNFFAYPDKSLSELLENNPPELLASEQIDNLGRVNLSLVFPVIKNKKLVGYFKLNIKIIGLIQKVKNILATDDLLELSNGAQSKYFKKFKDELKEDNSPILTNYKFSEKLSFSVNSYKISVAQNNDQILANTIYAASLRLYIILILSSIMLITYNLIEKKKAKKIYNDNNVLVEEIFSQEKLIQNLNNELKSSNHTIKTLTQQKYDLKASGNIINEIELQCKHYLERAIIKIRDISLLKKYNANNEVTPEIINQTLANIHLITEDLISNIANRNSNSTEIDIAKLFDKLFILFAPIINNRSLKLHKKIKPINITTNELLLKQVLISLLFRIFSSSAEIANINITANKKDDATIIIEFSNDSYILSEEMINSILATSAKELPSNFINILLDRHLVEKIIKEVLMGALSITKKNHANNITLSLPLMHKKYNTSDNVIDFYQITK